MITVGLSYIRKHLWLLPCSPIFSIWVSSKKFQKCNIGWPRQPLTENMLRFNMIFFMIPPNIFFQNIKIKLNSRTWITLKSSVVIFQSLEHLQLQWPQQPQQPQWLQWPRQPHFIKKLTDPDGLIIPGTNMTNTTCPSNGKTSWTH